jgi:Protein of unknown function, DUF481
VRRCVRAGARDRPESIEAVNTMKNFSKSTFPCLIPHHARIAMTIALLAVFFLRAPQSKAAAPAANPAPDVLVLSNGDTLHGNFVGETAGTVTFHTDSLGDISISWDKIKEMHVTEKFGVLNKNVKVQHRKQALKIPAGTLDVANQAITIHPENGPALAPIPAKDAQFIMNEATLDKQINHQPNFFTGWSGPVTAGATLVTATQNQYTVSGAIGLVRVVPTVSWLAPRDRTSMDFNGSFGKITQPAYTNPGPPPTAVAAVTTKTAIYHADAERDEYFSPRFFALGQVAFDHNFSQDLALQQIYGGGMGWTAIKSPIQEMDLKATAQYEKQQFISGAAGTSQNLVGSTFSANYLLHLKLFTYTQGLAFIPAYNNSSAYSATETNSFAFPAYKDLSFSVGTLDSYLNDPPASLPPTKRNSFQFTMGLTYAIKSKY